MSALLYGGGNSQSYTEGTYSMPGWVAKDGNTYTFTAENLTDDSAINHLVVAFKTTFENGLADCYDPDPYYLLRRYKDIENSAGLWYYEYLSKATTLGIIRGNHENKFGVEADAEGEEAAYVTRAEFVKMAFAAAGIQCEVLNDEKKHWAENYMAKALEYKMVSYMLYEEDNNKSKYENGEVISSKDYYSPYFDDKGNFTRAEAAHIMNQLFLENADIVQVPTMLYRYDMNNIGQYGETKVSRWNNIVESEQPEEAYREDIFQMFMNDIMVGDGTGLHLADSLNRAEAVVLIMKPLFKLDDSFERVGTEYIDVYSPGKVLKKTLTTRNKTIIIQCEPGNYRLTVSGSVNYTVTNMEGEQQTKISGLVGNEVYDFSKSLYFLNISGDVGKTFLLLMRPLEQTMHFEYEKSSDSSFIYVNSPEYITYDDIVDEPNGVTQDITKRKIFEQKEVTGKNTYYQTHLSYWSEIALTTSYPEREFYLDVDLYNPTDASVTVVFKNLVAANSNNEGNGYSELQAYFDGSGKNGTITIPPGEHRLLLEEADVVLCTAFEDDWAEIITIMCDFEVLNQGHITVSSIAAYHQDGLKLATGEEDKLASGVMLDDGNIINDVDIRPNELGIYKKIKGIARNESAWINAYVYFTFDDSIEADGYMPIFPRDAYFPQGINKGNPKYSWQSGGSPYSEASNTILNSLPGGLHNFKYHYDDNIHYYAFDLEHHHAATIDETANPVNHSVDAETIRKYREMVYKGERLYFKKEENDETVFIVPDEKALTMGEYGTTYHTTFVIENTGEENRQLSFSVQKGENVIYGIKMANETVYTAFFFGKNTCETCEGKNCGCPNPNNENICPNCNCYGCTCPVWRELFNVTIESGKVTTFEIVLMSAGGETGLTNQVYIY